MIHQIRTLSGGVSDSSRRLPIYILLDTSGSMQGDPINQVTSQLSLVIDGLRANPQALETAHLCLITFGSTAKVEVPLTSLETFNIPTHLDASGSTAMGEALQLLCRTRAADLNRKTATAAGDWRPMVFLLTDGVPTDDFDAGLSEFKRLRWGVRVACAVNGADEDNLRKFLDNDGAVQGTPDETPNLIHISTSDAVQMRIFFRWLSDALACAPTSVDPDDHKTRCYLDSETHRSNPPVSSAAGISRRFSGLTLVLVYLAFIVLLWVFLA